MSFDMSRLTSLSGVMEVMESEEDKALGVVIAMVAWFILLAITMIIGPMAPFFATFKPKDRMPYYLRIVRSVAGFYGLYNGLHLLLKTELYAELAADPVTGVNPASYLFMKTILAFFAFEMITYLYVSQVWGRSDSTLLIHHILGLAGYSIYLWSGIGFWWGVCLFTEEISAPFTGVSWVLSKLNKPHTVTWLINQWILVVVWVFFRCGIDLMLLGNYFVQLPRSFQILPYVSQAMLFVGTGTMALYLNPYWLKVKATNALNWSPEPNKSFRKRE
ncbi:uncharacterized protein AMSG_07585 [Thecamonas trahens ATCC 50062]|uniref:TLC domain-containing protein n=1 Tax=Thecamonas trahens ATCC 50062 TaxID=461836 RepID=A0A0L0DGZ0_THETB|nr:hypothetical protein AMSG_07585 [Thecamonas trahens ATCC 50062]KNC51401.1 hypothetical protein AMSG_07585 [Thecamonas trahens ATCC 50062]|eukprot:XP_013756068.1 hypothetical protein AMSG_07585 [Thecamonas trahens ATCC 50062]